MTIRLLYLVDRPIQYQAPLLRLIAGLGDIDLRVVHKDAGGADGRFDAGFGRAVTWDVPLIDGYARASVIGTQYDLRYTRGQPPRGGEPS